MSASDIPPKWRLRDRIGQLAAGAWLGLLATLALPECAMACAACLRNADNRTEFIVTTGLLTFLPLIAIGSVIWWMRRRVLAMADEERRAARLASDPSTAPEPARP